ncbi:MAG TPA: hypothetical protein VD963_10750 [Phycisphaerales bacterium]|nr:hypothetical protein [Phycisphaerales bacterium]
MATRDLDDPVPLISARTEVEAASIASALEATGIAAAVEGGMTLGFRAEAPGEARVLVRRADLARARTALREAKLEADATNWDAVDVGVPETAAEAAEVQPRRGLATAAWFAVISALVLMIVCGMVLGYMPYPVGILAAVLVLVGGVIGLVMWSTRDRETENPAAR